MYTLKVKEIRESKNIKQSKLSRITNIPTSTLSDIENNKSDPRLSCILRISFALNVDVKDLYETCAYFGYTTSECSNKV